MIFGVQPEEGPEADSVDDIDLEEPTLVSPDLRRGPWDLWHQIRSYLVVDKSVAFVEDERREGRRAQVSVRVHNTAPDSSDWPAVHFKSVTGECRRWRLRKLGEVWSRASPRKPVLPFR